MPRRIFTAEERYLAKVDKSAGPDKCWPWTGHRLKKGYGLFWDGTHNASGNNHLVVASRWGYEHFVGPIPAGFFVLHRCDNPPCQNPKCWFLGTNKDNVNDRVIKGRGAKGERSAFKLHPELYRGENHYKATLTEDDVREIRRRYAAGGITQQALGDEFGLHNVTISKIITRQRWAHVD
jgi:hypothetical protein